MINKVLIYAGAILPAIWGVAHLFPTSSIVKGFGELSDDNRRIITMEWIIEGLALIFIGVLVCTVTIVDFGSVATGAVYWLSFGILNILSIVSLFTGSRIAFLPFRICPILFTGSSVLILLGLYIL